MFTRPDGAPREINPEFVSDISPADPKVNGVGAKTVIVMESGEPIIVAEDFAEVRRRLNW